MYSDFYGFSERPFEITPDPKFLYQSRGHREVLAALVYGIMQRRGFIAVVGEVGTGKTTLLWSLLDRLTKDVKVANIFNTDVTFDDLLHMVLVDLELTGDTERLSKVEAHQRLNELAIRQLRNGGNVLIMVDEAQNLDHHCMENLRLLSNLETRKHKLLQIILSGQPELEEKLNRPELRQLSQRINVKRYVLPFDETETYAYIRHRLTVANYSGAALFTDEAQRLIWEYSAGIPRKINAVCDNALLTGYALKERKIGINTVREVIGDLSRNFFVERAKITPVSAPNPEPQPEAKTPPAATIISEAQASRRPFLSIQSLLPIILLTLIVGVGLATWRRHLNENSAPVLPGNTPATATEVGKNLADTPIAPPRPESTTSETARPGAALETYSEASADITPQPQPELIHENSAPVLPGNVPVAATEVGKDLADAPVAPPRPESTTNETAYPGAALETYSEASADITPQPQPEPIQVEVSPPPSGEEKIPEPTEKTSLVVKTQEPDGTGPWPDVTTLVVRDGESLSKVIIRNFGTYDKAIEQEILKVNPGIKNPDLVFPDQIITIPNLPLVPER